MGPRRERRRATRVRSAIDTRLAGPDGSWIAARLENLSLVGLAARVSRRLSPGMRCRVELATDGIVIEARGTIVRASGRALALRFEELPYESFERLRAVLLAHADDPAVIADELTDRLGFLGESA